jgi:D-sedoheptulose 7-phosphate isomerase
MTHTESFLREATQAIALLDQAAIEQMVQLFVRTRRQGGRLFILGVGGSAANASHAVNDFRKLAGMEAYAPTDNVSELTARVNDEGWDTAFARWLEGSRLTGKDLVLVLSVGGGSREKQVSVNLVKALEYAVQVGTPICGIVGRDGGHTAQVAQACAVVPTISPRTLTPLAESFQALIWHLIVSHPDLQVAPTKW